MAGSLSGIRLIGGTYHARIGVPKDVQGILGRWQFQESLRTGDIADARKIAPPIHFDIEQGLGGSMTSVTGGPD
jgi:hypothetical protein